MAIASIGPARSRFYVENAAEPPRAVGVPSYCSWITRIICASAKQLFRIRCFFNAGQTLHHGEGFRGRQISGNILASAINRFGFIAAGPASIFF
ncbi:hypothetical protein METH_07600 [Leisingera methylohalidivorans DSM 14336]|uniref:Uncharacterized protein n=1 Tax=Leisingera methylohalidivorans DSM 14336 TaxID=999552 RepID=V9W020_9RHOB|nr:hypothetical protein METH_07600 [Leisingera methylohalidivorans DSM 14336]